MKYLKLLTLTTFILPLFFITGATVLAEAIPFPNVNILIKSITSGQVISTYTDDKGNFSSGVSEESGLYKIFMNDESFPPVKVIAKKGIVSGRIVILTDGTTTKDPAPVVVKKPTKVKVKKSKSTTATTKSTTP